MSIAKYKKMIVALLMMTIIGQALGSTSISCQTPPVEIQMLDAGMMDHSRHMATSESPDEITFECCPDCDCSLGGFATAPLPKSKAAFAPYPPSFTNSYYELAENQLAVSLFRPPIAH